MMLLGWGDLRHLTYLGWKTDECPNCGQIGTHSLARRTTWMTVLMIPVALAGVDHVLICRACGAREVLPKKVVHAALNSGSLPLARQRPSSEALRQELAAERGIDAPEGWAKMDELHLQAHRDPWDVYSRIWPILATLVAGVAAIWVLSVAWTGAKAGQARPNSRTESPVATAASRHHLCWLAEDGTVAGCELNDGTRIGDPSGGKLVYCDFDEPLSPATTMPCLTFRY